MLSSNYYLVALEVNDESDGENRRRVSNRADEGEAEFEHLCILSFSGCYTYCLSQAVILCTFSFSSCDTYSLSQAVILVDNGNLNEKHCDWIRKRPHDKSYGSGQG